MEEEKPSTDSNYAAILLSIVKQLASTTGDLYSLTCPAILLSPQSLLEYSLHWCDHPKLFTQLEEPITSLDRMVGVVRWFISTLYGAYASRWIKGGNEKKPFNPVLGEQFIAEWNDGDIKLWSEQVSHHPPISAFYFESTGVFLVGHNGQKTKFTGTAVRVEQMGSATLFLKSHHEEYFITLPELHIRGLLMGKLFLELTGNTTITCSSGYTAYINFVPKKWVGGEYHGIEGTIHSTNNPSDVKFNLFGRWIDKSYYKVPNSANQELLFDTSVPATPPNVQPIEKQGSLESRKLWNNVAVAISSGDFALASKEKNVIEEEQRRLRKERAAANENWHPTFFKRVPCSWLKTKEVGFAFTSPGNTPNCSETEEGAWIYGETFE